MLLRSIGERVRLAREKHGWTQATLAARSGISTRYIVNIEAGAANISLLRLRNLSQTLGIECGPWLAPHITTPSAHSASATASEQTDTLQLLRAHADICRQFEHLRAEELVRPIALVGMLECHRQSYAQRLSQLLHRRYVSFEEELEREVGLTGDAIRELFGAERLQALEFSNLAKLLAKPSSVLVTRSNIAANAEAFDYLLDHAFVIWLDTLPSTQALSADNPTSAWPDSTRASRDALVHACKQWEPRYTRAHARVVVSGLSIAQGMDKLLGVLHHRDGETPAK
ncbi:hypothetical protein CS8_009130 [Cupriavidus sp. 8B]